MHLSEISKFKMSKKKAVFAAPVALQSVERSGFNWDACCICQSSNGTMQCPLRNLVKENKLDTYHSLGNSLDQLKKFEFVLPSGFPVTVLDEGKGIAETLIEKQASWHRKCVARFLINERFEKLLKTLSEERQEVPEEVPQEQV